MRPQGHAGDSVAIKLADEVLRRLENSARIAHVGKVPNPELSPRLAPTKPVGSPQAVYCEMFNDLTEATGKGTSRDRTGVARPLAV